MYNILYSTTRKKKIARGTSLVREKETEKKSHTAMKLGQSRFKSTKSMHTIHTNVCTICMWWERFTSFFYNGLLVFVSCKLVQNAFDNNVHNFNRIEGPEFDYFIIRSHRCAHRMCVCVFVYLYSRVHSAIQFKKKLNSIKTTRYFAAIFWVKENKI